MTGPTAVSTGYVVVWECLCSDASDVLAALAAECPGHGTSRVASPVTNPRPGPTTGGHRCWERRCDRRHGELEPTRGRPEPRPKPAPTAEVAAVRASIKTEERSNG